MNLVRRVSCACAVVLVVALALSSCGGGGSGTQANMVLIGFNQPNLSGVALDQPLIFTFSDNVDIDSVTPDSLRVLGTPAPFFERTVVDGNLLALLPRVPNFDDYRDSGLARDTQYTVNLPVFPASATIRSTSGNPLLSASSYTFHTTPTFFFIEPRRPINRDGNPPDLSHEFAGPPYSNEVMNDSLGCLQNSANSLFQVCVDPVTQNDEPYLGEDTVESCVKNAQGVITFHLYDNTPERPRCSDPARACLSEDPLRFNSRWCNVQSESCPGARLLCLVNEGSPRVLVRDDGVPPDPNENTSSPSHGQVSVGLPSSTKPGYVELPALRVRFNEPLDPLTVTPLPTSGLGVNVQLWRVGDVNRAPLIGAPQQIKTNIPVTVQSISRTEIILVPSGAVLQGTYLINLKPAVRDLSGKPLHPDTGEPSATATGFSAIDTSIQGKVPSGFRIYFVTLALPNTPQALTENYGNNISEHGDNASVATEPGVFTRSVPPSNPNDFVLGGAVPASPSVTLIDTADGVGQSTTANWNAGFRFLNLSQVDASPEPGLDDGLGHLKATWQPYAGDGQDGVFDTSITPGGETRFLNTDTGSQNGDGIFEYESFHLGAGDVLQVIGSHPLVILCRGDFQVDGTIDVSGLPGEPGFDTDGTSGYTNAGHAPTFGAGGVGGPGGGPGGRGANPLEVAGASLSGVKGVAGETFEFLAQTAQDFQAIGSDGGLPGAGGASTQQGGGGGGFGATGGNGTDPGGVAAANAGGSYGTSTFVTLLSAFQPDRGYSPNSQIMGGSGGGGGGAEDDSGAGAQDPTGAAETGDGTPGAGDDAGGGGGGGGGALFVIAGGQIQVASGGSILANGGAGGDTYSKANQTIVDPDGIPNNADDVFVGAAPGAVVSGQGAPGGGGSGGGILLIAKDGIVNDGSIQALGGAGGTSGDADLDGGAGAGGRVAFGSFPSAPAPSGAGSVSSGSFAAFTYNPTVDLASSGQTVWFNIGNPNADFYPRTENGPDGIPNTADDVYATPFFTGNFDNPNATDDLNDPLPSGYGLTRGVDFDAVLEMQGADDVVIPGGGGAPTSVTGLTAWIDVTPPPPPLAYDKVANIDQLDGKQFIRYRWRFFVRDGYPGTSASPTANGPAPMPTIFDVTIPFTATP